MTLILAQKYDQGIVIASDMLRVNLDNESNNVGLSNDKILKIQIIHKGIGIAVAGLGSLSDSCKMAIQSIFKAKSKASFDEVKSCTIDYFKFAQQQFSTYAPEHSAGMAFLLFGFDKNGTNVMFHYDSRTEFNEVVLESPVGFGSGMDKAINLLNNIELNDPNNFESIGNNFIHVIRETARLDSTVGENAHVVVLDKEKWFEMAMNEKDEFLIKPRSFSML